MNRHSLTPESHQLGGGIRENALQLQDSMSCNGRAST